MVVIRTHNIITTTQVYHTATATPLTFFTLTTINNNILKTEIPCLCTEHNRKTCNLWKTWHRRPHQEMILVAVSDDLMKHNTQQTTNNDRTFTELIDYKLLSTCQAQAADDSTKYNMQK